MELAAKVLPAESAKARERVLLDAVVASVGEGMYIETAAGIHVNPEARRLLALPPGLDPPPLAEIPAITLQGDPIPRGDQASQRAWNSRSPVPFVARTVRFDGVPRIMAGTVSPILDDGAPVGTVAVFRDVTDEMSAAYVNQRLLRDGFNLLPTAVSVLDLETKAIVDCNRAFCALTGLTREEVLGQAPPYSWWAEGLSSYLDGDIDNSSFESLFRHADGHPIPVQIVRFNIEEPSTRGGVRVALITDLSERRSMEQQLLMSGKLASIGELAAGVAHEINNPLFAIAGLVEFLLLDAEPGTKPHERLTLIQQTADEIKTIVRALLDFAREPSEDFRSVRVRDSIAQTVDLIRRTSANKGIEFVERYPDDSCEVHASPNQLKQVFLNLLSNARLSMPQGGRVEIGLQLESESVVVTVSDSGEGIPPEVLPRIFEPFYTTRRDRGGTGLGLSVSHGIIAAHGGALTAESTVGVGTTFTVRLPRGEGH